MLLIQTYNHVNIFFCYLLTVYLILYRDLIDCILAICSSMGAISERDRDLLRAYKEVLSEIEYPFSLSDVMERTVRKPAKRFYSSTKYAYMCVKALKEDKPVRYQQSEKGRMILEVWKRVQEEEILHPNEKLDTIVEMVMDSPAPEFYLKPSSAEVILCKAKRKQRFIEEQKIKSRYERIQRRKARKL